MIFVSEVAMLSYVDSIYNIMYIYVAESQVKGVVEQIPKSLIIPRSNLKMSNTSIGQG